MADGMFCLCVNLGKGALKFRNIEEWVVSKATASLSFVSDGAVNLAGGLNQDRAFRQAGPAQVNVFLGKVLD